MSTLADMEGLAVTTDGAYVRLYMESVVHKLTDDELAASIAHHTEMLAYLLAEQAQREQPATTIEEDRA